MGKPGIGEKLTRAAIIVLMHQNPSRNDPQRSFDNAHVLIEHQMVNVGAIEQRPDRRDQNRIVGSYQFAHQDLLLAPSAESFYTGRQWVVALAAFHCTFYAPGEATGYSAKIPFRFQ